MPNYPGVVGASVPVASNASPIALAKPGDYCYVWGVLSASATQLPVTDLNVVGESLSAQVPIASIAVELPQAENAGPPMVCIEGAFSAAPGAFSLQIQESDTDADGCYITPTNANYTVTALGTTSGGTQRFRVDLSPTGGKFLRGYLASLTNNVKVLLKFTRLA